MQKEQITLIGCGWLGLPLCEKLSALGHTIVTTTNTQDKNVDLAKKFKTYLFDITKNTPEQELLESGLLIYTIPPLGLGEVESFFKSIDENKKIIFISSTAVYGKNQGEVSEKSSFAPNTKNAQVLREAESYLKNHFKNLTIVRPGGLYGEKRHPVYFLVGKTNITSGDEYLHLVHRDDCVKAITKIIELDLLGEDFNLVSDLRILKKDYYTKMAKILSLNPPQYDSQAILNPTKINNDKSKKLLSLQYRNPEDFR